MAKKDIAILVETAREMNTMDVLDRFVIQFYNVEMYEAIKDIYDFPNYIFTLYAVWYGDESEFIDYCCFCMVNGVHTVNDWETAKEMFFIKSGDGNGRQGNENDTACCKNQ